VNDNATIVLKPVGDVELWYAEADDCSWRLPLHVEWKEDPSTGNLYGLILPGTCFYQNQSLLMNVLLGSHSLEDRQDRWLVPRSSIESLLHKAPGIHAEFYHYWPDNEQPSIPSHHELTVPARRPAKTFGSFVEFVSAERGLPADVVQAVLTAIAQVGPRWLVQYNQPINLGFVDLLAVPFRANWKEIVLFKGKANKLIEALLKTGRECRQRLTSMRFPATLCSPQNIALCGGVKSVARIDYSIEAVSTEDFDEAIEKIEGERMEAGDYVAQHSKSVERLYESIIECLARYARKTQAAWAAVRKGGNGSEPTFVPSVSRAFNHVCLTNMPVDIIPADSDFSVYAEQNRKHQPIIVPTPAVKMPKMSSVPSTAHDVRSRRRNGNLDQP